MDMPRRLALSLITLVLIGCSLTQLFVTPSSFDLTTTAIAAANYEIPLVLTTTFAAQPTAIYQQCSWRWATQPLPELSAQIQADIDAAGLTNVTVSAAAFGEDCIPYETNVSGYFATMETDFSVTAQVDNLEDEEALGNLTAQILAVLDQIPPEDIRGPQPGYITLAFVAGDAQRNLRFSVTQADAALEQGLTGAALFQQLNTQP
jgi:hypothetical protein